MTLAEYAEGQLDILCSTHPIGYRPVIRWKNLRVTAGIAYIRGQAIGLSRLVLTDEASLRETLVHEYAHLLAVHRHGAQGGGHGEPWRQAMRDLGAPPIVHHRFEVARNQPRQAVTYECLKCGRLIERSRRLPRRRKYLHSSCGGEIRLKSVARLV